MVDDRRDKTQLPPGMPDDPSASFNPYRSELISFTSDQETPLSVGGGPPQLRETERLEPPDSADGVPVRLPEQAVYRFLQQIGRGGHGEVWEAVQPTMHRIIAIKALREDIFQEARSNETQSRQLQLAFRQEALTTGILDHPNVPPVHDFATDKDGRPLLAMKRVRGKPWDKMIFEDFAMEMEEFLQRHLPVLVAVTQAVAFSHSRGIVHRDIKPSQVMVGEFGEVMLMDWGLAVVHDTALAREHIAEYSEEEFSPPVDRALNPAGTAAFMAPEQTTKSAAGIGPWTDVYLLGATLYYLLTGIPPHHAPEVRATFVRAQLGHVERPEERASRRAIPAELSNLCMKAMARESDRRTASALEFAGELRDYLTGANRRRESAALCAGVTERLEGARHDYAELSSAQETLQRALLLWPGNAEALVLRAQVLDAHARAAMENEDLVLARVQAEALPAGGQRASLLAEIAALAAAVAGRERQRRLAKAYMYLFAVLLLLACGAGGIYWVKSSADLRIAKLEAAEQRHELEKREFLVGQLRRIGGLYSRERDLAARLATTLPVPRTLEPVSAEETFRLDPERARELIAEIGELQAERAALASETAGQLDPVPPGLALGEANFLLHSAVTPENFAAAYAAYARAAASRPGLPEAHQGLGIAAFRAGEATSATMHLAEAAELTRRQLGPESTAMADVTYLHAGAAKALGDESTDFMRLFEQSFDVLEPQWLDLGNKLAIRHHELGMSERALQYTSPTLDLLLADRGERDPATISTMSLLGLLYTGDGQHRRAEEVLRRALETSDGVESVPAFTRAAINNNLALALMYQGRPRDALPYLEAALHLHTEEFGTDNIQALTAMQNLAAATSAAGDHAGAENLLRECIAVMERLYSRSHPHTLRQINNLAGVLYSSARVDEAAELFEEVYRARLELLGPQHEETLISLNNIGGIAYSLGRLDEALEYFTESLRIREERLGRDHADTMTTRQNLAMLLTRMGRAEEAEVEMRALLDARIASEGADSFGAARAHASLGTALQETNRLDEAIAQFDRAIELYVRHAGPLHQRTLTARMNRAAILRLRGDYAEARPELVELLALNRDQFGPDHVSNLELLNQVALCDDLAGNPKAAEQGYRDALAIAMKAWGPEHPDTGRVHMNIATALARQRRYADAAVHFEQALAALTATFGENNPITAYCLNGYGLTLSHLEQFERAEEMLRRGLAAREAIGAEAETARSAHSLGVFLVKNRRAAEAEPLFDRAVAVWTKERGSYDADTVQARIGRAGARWQLGRVEEAKAEFRDLLEAHETGEATAHLQRGVFYAELARHLELMNLPREATTIQALAALDAEEGHPDGAEGQREVMRTLARLRGLAPEADALEGLPARGELAEEARRILAP